LLGDVEHRRLADAIGFAARPVRDVMVARDQIVAIDRSAPLPDVERRLLDSGHSRLPIYDRDIDHVLGFVHVKDLLAIEGDVADRPVPLRSVRRMLLVSVNRHLPDVLTVMRRSRLHVALVVDSDGRTAGLVTLEDIPTASELEIPPEPDPATQSSDGKKPAKTPAVVPMARPLPHEAWTALTPGHTSTWSDTRERGHGIRPQSVFGFCCFT
jgi:CBS domain containing-hemolysin-like protein